jgi:repressor LexA
MGTLNVAYWPTEKRTMQELTGRQQAVLDSIKDHIRRHGVPPTRTELAHGLGLAEASSVAGHLKRLTAAGRITILANKNRAIRVLDEAVPLLDALAEVAAGTPIISETHILERVPAAIADRFHPRPDYLLTVRGDSIDLTGITDGSLLAVKKTGEAKTGQLIVARFGDEVTVKRFVRIDARQVELRPESRNTGHKVMKLDLAKHILKIEGVVVGALITGLDDTETMTRNKSSHGK